MNLQNDPMQYRHRSIEERLEIHAKQAGLGKVMTVDDNALAYLLYHDHTMHPEEGEYLREEIAARKTGKTLIRPSLKEIGLYAKAGVFIPAEELLQCGISHDEFLKYFGIDINKGLALVNGSIPEKENRLHTQIHETIHSRDYLNGLKHLEKSTPECQAYEVLTDTRALMFDRLILPDEVFDFSKGFSNSKIKSRYIGLNNQNVQALKSLTKGLNPRVDMTEILSKLKEYLDWTHGRSIQDLLLKAPAYDNHFSKDNRRQAVHFVLDNLISLEEQSKLEQVVPVGFENDEDNGGGD